VTKIFALLLVVEGLASALRATTRLSAFMVYPGAAVFFMALRLVVAVEQFTAGWMAMDGRPFARTFAPWVYLQSAVLVTFELGFRMAPTNLFPAYRWWAVALYWIYAVAGMYSFRRCDRAAG
jgi:hypothetical protein